MTSAILTTMTESSDEGFEGYLESIGNDSAEARRMGSMASEFMGYLEEKGLDLEKCELINLKDYLSVLIARGENSKQRLLSIARYCYFHHRYDLYIYMATILNSYDILPLMEKRMGEMFGRNRQETVFYGFVQPPLGTDPDEYAPIVSRIIDRMESELSEEQCRALLSWNYHGIPKEAFAEKRARYLEADSLDEFLAREHELLIEELQECMSTGRPWHEQMVTQDLIDHVTAEQRVVVGMREGDRIIVEKVPFDPPRYYPEGSLIMRRYYYCHCPLVRSSIRKGWPKVSPTFCYCSASFLKAAWDAIFDRPVEVEVLKSVLGGSSKCLFSVKIPEGEKV